MQLATIQNFENSVDFDFGSFSSAFDAKKLVVDKGGVRMYLGPNDDYIQIIFSDGDKVELQAGIYQYFQNPDQPAGITFTSMVDLFDKLAEYMHNRIVVNV